VTERADVVIIGGGIVGAACAYFMCRAGLQVHLLERNFPASGTSRACDSLILLWDKTPGPELALGQASAALWTELAGSLDFGFEYARHGTILVAEDEQTLAAGCARASDLAAAGVHSEILDRSRLLSLEPELAPDLAGGIFFPDDAQIDSRRATLALLLAAQQQGLMLQTRAEVTGIRRGANGRISGVVTATGEIATERVVCAAGVCSGQIGRLVDFEVPVQPRQGQILVTAKVPNFIHHPLLEGGYVATVQSAAADLQVALVAELTASGTLLLGSSRRFSGFDRSTSPTVLQAIAARAVRFLPGLVRVSIIRSYAGLRPWSPDHLPLIGPTHIPGFYLATGHEGAGIGLAPITGQLLTAWLTGGNLPFFAAQVHPGRFNCGDISRTNS
jgi:glycine/D-amino acid oxidase-like deaminating enzyme